MQKTVLLTETAGGDHKKCFVFMARQVEVKNGYVMDVTVSLENVQDSVAFGGLYDR